MLRYDRDDEHGVVRAITSKTGREASNSVEKTGERERERERESK
jgi:hypothetical protein